jgi:hypothetical protein
VGIRRCSRDATAAGATALLFLLSCGGGGGDGPDGGGTASGVDGSLQGPEMSLLELDAFCDWFVDQFDPPEISCSDGNTFEAGFQHCREVLPTCSSCGTVEEMEQCTREVVADPCREGLACAALLRALAH